MRRFVDKLLFALNTTLYHSFFFVASFLSRPLAFRVALQVGGLSFRHRRARLRPFQSNLEKVLRVSPEQAAACLRRIFEFTAFEILEMYLFTRLTRQEVSRLIQIRGLENLKFALARSRGAILSCGHFRSLQTFAFALGLHGYKLNIVGRMSMPYARPVERWFYERRLERMQQKSACHLLSIQADNFGVAVKATNALGRNEVLLISVDTSYTNHNIDVRFLNAQVPFPLGPALIAQTSRAPLLNLFMYRENPSAPLIAEIGAPFYASDDLAATTQRCASWLEERILEHPESWTLWLAPEWYLWKTQNA